MRIATGLSRHRIDSVVAVLGPPGPISEKLEASGVRTEHLNISSPLGAMKGVMRLRHMAGESSPDVIHGWMYHGNLAALMAIGRTDARLAWNIRHAMHRDDLLKRLTRLVVRMNCFLSGRADAIVFNSTAALNQHVRRGLDRQHAITIPNGIDVHAFAPDETRRNEMRSRFGWQESDIVVCAVGRSHPAKGHEVMAEVAKRVLLESSSALFVLAGRGISWDRDPFRSYAEDRRLTSRMILLDQRDDIPDLLRASDVVLSTSHTEGFPNAVAEGMASGLPAVVTDVGDTRLLVGDTGFVRPAADIASLATALLEVVSYPSSKRHELGRMARERVAAHFSLEKIVDRYAQLYFDLKTGVRPMGLSV